MSSREIKAQWLNSLATVEFLKQIEKSIEEIQSLWGSGQFTGSTQGETIQLNAKAIGTVEALKDILYLARELPEEDEDNDTTGGTQSTY